NALEAALGEATDGTTEDSVFGKLNDIQDSSSSSKSSASAVLFTVQQIQAKLGTGGNIIDKDVDDLLKAVDQLQENVAEISETTAQSTVEITDLIGSLLEQIAEVTGIDLGEVASGLGLGGSQGGEGQGGAGAGEGSGAGAGGEAGTAAAGGQSIEELHQKADRMLRMLEAILESIGTNEITVETYFEES
ncbi:MAG: hypothetical protein KC618_06010, partial [Candidatus Omnitrophica bacterium]|nr:hypothetical protein [Candidatus Omnitrophota bacterium]